VPQWGCRSAAGWGSFSLGWLWFGQWGRFSFSFLFLEGKNGYLWERFVHQAAFHFLVFNWHVEWLLVGKKPMFFAMTGQKLFSSA
jgi:hypothetical protein